MDPNNPYEPYHPLGAHALQAGYLPYQPRPRYERFNYGGPNYHQGPILHRTPFRPQCAASYPAMPPRLGQPYPPLPAPVPRATVHVQNEASRTLTTRIGRDTIVIPDNPNHPSLTPGDKAQIYTRTLKAIREAPTATWREKVSFLSQHFENSQHENQARGKLTLWSKLEDPTFYTATFINYRDATFNQTG